MKQNKQKQHLPYEAQIFHRLNIIDNLHTGSELTC